MEARKITIVQTKDQKKSVIMSSATTLSELKADLRQNGIDYSGMTFFEGTSKIELKDDSSVLPHDVPYKGNVTNELVFMLTNTNKKIKSGAMNRKEVYNKITELGLQDECKREFGRNFTQCTTADLISLVASVENTDKKPTPTPINEEKKEEASVSEVKTPKIESKEVVDNTARAAISKLVEVLYENGTLCDYEKDDIMDILEGKVKATPSENNKPSSMSPYSDDEIDDMFKGMNIG